MSEPSKTRPTRPRRLAAVDRWDIETDVAVIGFGGAGACAAIEAHDAGAATILFELASAAGGSTALSSAEIYMGGNGGTRVQRACGYQDSTEDMYRYLMLAGGEQVDEAKVRTYCDGSVDHFDWLVACGVPYKDSEYRERAIMALNDDCLLYTGNEKAWPFSAVAAPCPRGHNLQVEGDNGGPLLMKILGENVVERGIRVEYDARALTLIADEDNQVHGVVVRIDQRELNVRARRGVVLCAGGFVMNPSMLKKYAPMLLRGSMPIGNPGDTGSGILMGMGVGAATINMHEGFISIPFYPPAATTFGILINARGQRFINEDCYHGRVGWHLLHQIGDRFYFVLSAEGFKRPSFLNADIAGTGETIAELAEELGLDAEELGHTVEFYNRHAEQGVDPLFHKHRDWLKPIEPPYVALDCTPGRGVIIPYFTLGGLDTLPTGEALTGEREPIPGLYAAGRTTAGLPRTGSGYSSGMSVGDVTFFGRMAGRAAGQAPRRG